MERLQKLLAQAGIASRRASEELILSGRVTVDGEVVRELGTKADLAQSEVCVDGQPIAAAPRRHHIALNKPAGHICTREDTHGRPTVMDLIPAELRTTVYPVGRLDRDSSGLLLLTNDGPLAHKLIHPRYHVPKTYIATVHGEVRPSDLARLRHGVEIADEAGRPSGIVTAPAEVRIIANAPGKGSPSRLATLEIILREGRKRQVRRMCHAVGHPVVELRRTVFGSVPLGDLPPGKWRELTEAEVAALRALVGKGAASGG
jgi:23S rRNA pseudouridine2605 synthase